MQNDTTTDATALDTLLAHPVIGGMIAAAPALAQAAAAARAERAALAEALDAARAEAEAASTGAPGAPVAAPTRGPAPIIRAPWNPDVPAVDPTFAPPDDLVAIMRAALVADRGVLMTGPAGTGKTEAARHVAATMRRPFYIVDCGPIRDSLDWFGSPTLVGGRVAWQDSTLVEALNTPDCIVLLDEVNRAHTCSHSALLPLLDSRRSIQFPQRPEPVRIHPSVRIVATANIGAEHVGTGAITPALRSRFVTVPTDYMEPDAEAALIRARFPSVPAATAEAIAHVAAYTRTAQWSARGGEPIPTRNALTCAALVAALVATGGAVRLAFRAMCADQPSTSYGSGSGTPATELAAYVARTYPSFA